MPPQSLAAPSPSGSAGRSSPSPSYSRNRSTSNATAATCQAPLPTPQIHVASSSPTPPLPSPASSRAPSPRIPSASTQHTWRPSTSPSGSTTSTSTSHRHQHHHPCDDAEHLRAVNAGFERAMAGTSTIRARAKSDTGPASKNSPKAGSPSIWERAGSARRSGEVDYELERRWGAWERGEDLPYERKARPKSIKVEVGEGKRIGRGGGGTIPTEEEEQAARPPPPQPAPGLLKRLRSKIVKDKDRIKEIAERTNDPSPDYKYGPY